MAYALDDFCRDCHDILTRDATPEGRERLRRKLEQLLANAAFIAETFHEDDPAGKRRLYHDSETGVQVLAHVQKAGKKGAPHSHGTSWAIYGNATGTTRISLWRRENPAEEDHAELVLEETHTIAPGQARTYEIGAIHSTEHPEPAWVIRVTGADLDTLPRYHFNPKRDRILTEA